ncbi:MAG: hypothetical protein U0704_17125 [Candidatus Eisenbacteria bacterium]
MRIRLALLVSALLVAVTVHAQPRPKPYTPKTPAPAPAAPAAPAAPVNPKLRGAEFINGVPDTGQFLADDAVLARVDDHVIRVGDFVSAYFNSYPEFRPAPDSAGRVEFLTSMIHKEVLGRTARAINRPLGFEDRLALRTHTQRALSNVLFMRLVSDSVRITPDDVSRVYGYMNFELRLRHIVFIEREVAAQARAELLAKRITWEQAYRKYHRGPAKPADGVLGWTTFSSLPPAIGLDVFSHPVGWISEPEVDEEGVHLIQALEQRPAQGVVPEFNASRTLIRVQLQNAQIARYSDRVQSVLRRRAQVTYDTTAMRRFATRFQSSNIGLDRDASGAPQLNVNGDVPEFSPEDTATVIARWKDGKLTFAALLHSWMEITPLARPPLNSFESMRAQVDGIVLEPYSAVYATELGLDRDSMAVALIESKREEVLVKHLFADSIESRTWISKADRQKYYREHPAAFTTYPTVEYAALTAARRSEADSLVARLRSGVDARTILREDSLAGHMRGSIQTRQQNENGPWHKVLFEEMRPGQTMIDGPDRHGDYLVLQLRAFDPGRLLPYEQVEGMVDESLQNIRQEEALNAMLARFMSRFKIETHPERLMLVKLVDPTLD